MCEQHASGLSRRSFGALALGGLALYPLRAAADAHIDALAVTCIDYRFVSTQVSFLDKTIKLKNYDQVALAGGALAAVSPKFPKSVAAFWQQVGLARKLHNIERVVFVDHRNCGAYEAAFGPILPGPGDPELRQHEKFMRKAKALLKKLHSDLGSAFDLTEPDGSINEIAI